MVKQREVNDLQGMGTPVGRKESEKMETPSSAQSGRVFFGKTPFNLLRGEGGANHGRWNDGRE